MADQALDTGFRERVEQAAARLKPTRLSPELVPWGDGPDPDRFWVPECLLPLWGTPAYDDLTDEQRLRYNQYYALELSEQFLWLEIGDYSHVRVCVIAAGLNNAAVTRATAT